MGKLLNKIIKFSYFFLIVFTFNNLNAEILKKFEVEGNSRISDETIKVYGEIELNKDYTSSDINSVIKKLYETQFFSKISTSFSNGILKINVEENPIIHSILIEGEKAAKFKKAMLKILSLKEKGSYIEGNVKNDIELIKSFYKSIGFYLVEVEAKIQNLDPDQNRVNLIFSVNKGQRNEISKIFFTGDKKVKDKRLRDVITSEETKPWKFLSKNIYLSEDRVELDKRLLKNYYLGLGYYNVEVLSSRAELKDKKYIELTYSINAGKRFRMKKLSTDIDDVFDKSIFQNLNPEFTKYAGGYYSPFKIEKILKKIDQIIDKNELQFVQHSVSETMDNDSIDVVFKIFEGRKVQVERINIKGNNVTNDSVIRSELLLDEGDPYSQIKIENSINALKARNIFKSIKPKIIDGSAKDLKIVEISVEEKATGEIAAGAGVGTQGTTFMFTLKENNYLGKGLAVDASINASQTSLRGGINITDPNYNYTGNMVQGGFSSTRNDSDTGGYENTINQFSLGTRFEQYEDVYFSPNLNLGFDDLRVDSTASESLKKQAGNFTEFYFGYGIERDKRDRPFMPTDGSKIKFSQILPVYADQAALTNSIAYSGYHLFTEDVVGALRFYGAAITGIDDDVRLSKRLNMPSNRLRGFESGKVGPKDGLDYVGGNYVTTLNLEAALPNLLPEATNTDVAVFMDLGNIWGADYDSSVGESNKLRSSIGLATNMFTPVGPLNFVFAQSLSSAGTDRTETFRFQLGTSF